MHIYLIGQDNSKGSGFFFILYKIFLICWISFGLGYTVMIMTFITRGMRSKKITRIERKLAINLKHTQSKIWNEFNKEINYLRRVFNELQLSKVKVKQILLFFILLLDSFLYDASLLHACVLINAIYQFNIYVFSIIDFQRIYVDECNYEIPPSKFCRSNSFPDLRDLLYASKEKDEMYQRPRRRANSEVVPTVS